MRITLFLLFIVALSGCSGYQYVASPQYVPYNSKKGDLKANISYNHVQLGYAVGNHISVFATGFNRKRESHNLDLGKENSGKESYADRSHEINIGTSYFTSTKKIIYELHAGTGFGQVHFQHRRDYNQDYFVEMNASKRNIFIQPSIALKLPNFKLREYFQFGAFAKIIREQYYDLDVISYLNTGFDNKPPDESDLYFIGVTHRNLYFIEPGISFRAGTKWVKGSAIVSAPISLQGNNVRHKQLAVNLSALVSFNVFKKANP
jgi:hypothetical protein